MVPGTNEVSGFIEFGDFDGLVAGMMLCKLLHRNVVDVER
jgi:hypothetical protein